jgi:hypothetical protein
LEIMMKRLALALVAASALSAPVAAQTLTILLPVISFPDPVVTPSTKGCGDLQVSSVCQLQE